ncbi:hypothetical protein ACHAWF_010235 [Thalassiosira exigua]
MTMVMIMMRADDRCPTATKMAVLMLALVLLLRPARISATAVKESLHATSSEKDASNAVDEEYESKIRQALSHHASKSNQILERTLNVEGSLVGEMEVGADGSVAQSSGSGIVSELKMLKGQAVVNDIKNEDEGFQDHEYDEGSMYDDSEDDSDDEGYDDDYYGINDLEDYNGDYRQLKDQSVIDLLDSIEDDSVRRDIYDDIVAEARMKAKLDPKLWYKFRYWELHAFFLCDRVLAGPRPIYDWDRWTEIRQIYHEFVQEDLKDHPIPEGSPERSYLYGTDDYDPPMNPAQSGGEKGRGLFASRDISKGEMVFKATNNTIIFTHGHTWRKFLFHLYERNGKPFDSETTCDILVWSWIQTLEKDGPLVIVMDLDNGSLLNEGREEPGWDPPNIRCGKEGDEFCLMEYFATKDIKKDDEILSDYRQFGYLDGWVDMGL